MKNPNNISLGNINGILHIFLWSSSERAKVIFTIIMCNMCKFK